MSLSASTPAVAPTSSAALSHRPLAEVLHQSVIVENKVGAGGTIAAELVARANKDGYTALMTSPAHTVSAAMLKSIRYDAVKDFADVSWVANSSFVVVAKKDFPANDIKGLIALAKASPGKLNFADVAVGSTQNFAGELLRQMTGIDVKHIPYSSTPGVITALTPKARWTTVSNWRMRCRARCRQDN